MYFFEISVLVFFSRYIPRSEIGGSYGRSVFSFLRNSILFFTVTASVYIPINGCMRVSFSPHSHYPLLFVIFLRITILTGVKWYHIVVLICISLMINDVSIFSCVCWPSVCLLWKNVYWALMPIFQLSCLLFDVEVYELFISLDINSLLVISFGNIFFPLSRLSFCFVPWGTCLHWP